MVTVIFQVFKNYFVLAKLATSSIRVNKRALDDLRKGTARYNYAGSILPFQCSGEFRPEHIDANIFGNHLNSVMLVFIGKLSLSTLR